MNFDQISAAIGIGIMRLVGTVEALFKRSRLSAFLQPAIGGLVLGGPWPCQCSFL